MLLLAVVSVLLATRPVPHPRQRRRTVPWQPAAIPIVARAHLAGDELADATAGFATIRLFARGRNRWDRADLARGIGPDFAVADTALALWPAPPNARP
jgi:hypothetical protein